MANTDLFKEAIADAKKLKEISMANAKQAIEEAFAPRIQEMFRMKLSEMESLEDIDEYAEMQPDRDMDGDGDIDADDVAQMKEGSDEIVDETTLEEILAELELEEEESALVMEKAKDDEEKEEETEEEEEEGEEEAEEETEEEDETEELNPEDPDFTEKLKALIHDAVAEAMGEQEGEVENLEAGAEEEVPGGDIKDTDGIINLDEILAELNQANRKYKAPVRTNTQLNEAVKTIKILKNQLNEVNLLNAKLLYVNKLFKSKSLAESQKVKVITAFDRATTIKETKNIYETLKESLNTTTVVKKAPLRESLGFASKPIGSAPARPIVEADAYVYRMQQLAGLKPQNI